MRTPKSLELRELMKTTLLRELAPTNRVIRMLKRDPSGESTTIRLRWNTRIKEPNSLPALTPVRLLITFKDLT